MITRSSFLILTTATLMCGDLAQAQAPQNGKGKPVYELRTYTANPGKLSELVRFFKEASDPAFTRHGMRSIGYWIPTDGPDHENTFVYILEHPSREEANKNWAAFRTDAEWVKARAAFEVNGALSGKIASVYMEQLDIPGAARSRAAAGSFELRTYTSAPGKLDNVIARFRDGTNAIFNRLNMPVIAYWRPTDGPEHDNTLIYIVAHPSKAAGVANWATFQKDPSWVKLRTESEAAGPIISKVVGAYMDPVEYSRWK